MTDVTTLRRLFRDDQFRAARKDGRKLALAIARDIIAYRRALAGAGIEGQLLDTLTLQFSQHWLGDEGEDGEQQIILHFGDMGMEDGE